MAKTPIEVIAAMLGEDRSPEHRIASAIVLGELGALSVSGARAPEVVKGLVTMLGGDSAPLQRPALASLARIASPKSVPSILPLLASKDAEVRKLAVDAIVACGEDVVPIVKERIGLVQGDERKALDAVLARFGDKKEAVHTLLSGLESSDPDVARAVAFELRPRVKEADAKTRRLWLGELHRIIERMKKAPPPSPIPLATAVKILGYLEDEKALETLIAFAKEPRTPFAVRQEAIIGMRFALSDESLAGEVIDVLVEAAEGQDRMIAQAALMGLASVELPAKHAARIARLATHPDFERARIAIEKLARQPGPEVTKALVELLAGSVAAGADRRRGELATKALEGREEAGTSLASALAAEKNADRANVLRQALRPHLKSLTPATKKKLVAVALERVAEGEGWQAHADVARELDPKSFAEGLREQVAKLAKAKKDAQLRSVLGLLSRTEGATHEDRYRYASLVLRASPLDTLPAARQRDEALTLVEDLTRRGFDVGLALKKDKSLELNHLFYVGFHFVEEDHPLGRELLEHVAKEGGRTKLAKMAKNKLGLASE
jgi:HEAT repeat protein